MLDVSLFGGFVGTLASGLSLVLLVTALLSLGFIGWTLLGVRGVPAMSGERRHGLLGRMGAGIAMLATFALVLFGVRIGSAWLATAAFGIAAAFAAGPAGAGAGLGGAFLVRSLRSARARRAALLEQRELQKARSLEEEKRLFLEAADVRAEVSQAETALAKLRGSFAELVRLRDAIAERERRAASRRRAVAGHPPARAAGLGRSREDIPGKLADLNGKVELGERVVASAELAVFRLACSEPLRRVVRRRPSEIVLSLAHEHATEPAQVESAARAIDAYMEEMDIAERALDALEARRPSSTDPDDDDDPLARAQRDLAAIKEVYGDILTRLRAAETDLSARAKLRDVATAAGAVSEKTMAAGLSEGELVSLVDEVTRADAAMQTILADDAGARPIVEALTRSSVALNHDEAASLDDLANAIRELRQ